MPTMVRSGESTANVNTSQHVRDVADELFYLNPNANPFTLLSQRASSTVADNFKYEWAEKDQAPRADQINKGAGYLSSDTDLVVDNSEYFVPGMLVKVPRTAEVFRVTAVTTATDTLTVVRAVGSTSAAALVDNDDLIILGSAHAEGAAVPTELTHQESWVYNYTQIFRTAFGATRTQENTRSYLGKSRTRLRKEKGIDHAVGIEEAFLFGERNRDTSSTNAPRSYTGGFLYYATSNGKNAGGTLTEPEIWDWCEDLFENTAGSDSRVLFASPLVVSVLDMLAGARLQTVPSDKTYGISTKQWLTSHGTLMVVKHRLLKNGAGGNGYGGYALAVEPKRIGYRFLANSNTALKTDRQNPGDDRWTDEYLSEVGFQLMNPEVHGVLSGVTG